MQITSFSTQAEFNEAMRLAHTNDNPYGILSNIYDDDYPHPYFNPEKLGFYRYRNFDHHEYTDRNTLPDKTIVFEDFEMYWPGKGDRHHELHFNKISNPLTERDYMITSCITSTDHMWPVPYVYNNYHFVKTHEVNKKQILPQAYLGPEKRLYLADVLLGNPKPHRATFFKLLRANSMLDRCIVNLFGIYKSKFLTTVDDKPQQIIDNATVVVDRYINTTDQLNNFFVSQYISLPIMNASWYSIVGETVPDNDCFFVTEKTAKPLMAGRPFIMLGGKHYLKHLRSLGFQTFSPVIDESYDEISNEQERVIAAFNSFRALSELDPEEVYRKLTSVLVHNQQMMHSKQALTQRARDFLEEIKLDHL